MIYFCSLQAINSISLSRFFCFIALIISDTMHNMNRGFTTLDLFFPPRVWPWDPCTVKGVTPCAGNLAQTYWYRNSTSRWFCEVIFGVNSHNKLYLVVLWTVIHSHNRCALYKASKIKRAFRFLCIFTGEIWQVGN